MINGIVQFLPRGRSDFIAKGEQRHLLAYFCMGLFGANFGLFVVTYLGAASAGLAAYGYWVVMSVALGCTIGLYAGRHWLGQAGLGGWMRAIVAIFWIGAMAAVIGGSIALPIYGTMFGPFTMIVSLIDQPVFAAIWAAMILGTHLLWSGGRGPVSAHPQPARTAIYP